MKISELAKQSGVPAKTIRYYEEIQLIPEAQRTASGYRDYDATAIDRLVLIRRCRELSIPLEQIKKLVRVQADRQAPCGEVDQIIAEQLAKVRDTLQELTLLESTLTQLAHSCANNTVGDCGILHQLESHHAH